MRLQGFGGAESPEKKMYFFTEKYLFLGKVLGEKNKNITKLVISDKQFKREFKH